MLQPSSRTDIKKKLHNKKRLTELVLVENKIDNWTRAKEKEAY
jgi:hypothetical protein